MLNKRMVLTGCMAALAVMGNSSLIAGGVDSHTFPDHGGNTKPVLSLRDKVQKTEPINIRLAQPNARVAAHSSWSQAQVLTPHSKGNKKRHRQRVAGVGRVRECAGYAQRDQNLKNSAHDAEVLPALIGELTSPVHAAFKKVHRAMQQLLINRTTNREIRDKKLILFQAALLAFVKNEKRWLDCGGMRQLFRLAMDRQSIDSVGEHTVRHFIVVRQSVYSTDEEQLIGLLDMIARRVQAAQNKSPRVRPGCKGVDDLAAQFEDVTLGEMDAHDEMDAQELYDACPDSRTILDEEEAQAMYAAYLDSRPVFEVAAAEEEEDEDMPMSHKDAARKSYERGSPW